MQKEKQKESFNDTYFPHTIATRYQHNVSSKHSANMVPGNFPVKAS